MGAACAAALSPSELRQRAGPECQPPGARAAWGRQVPRVTPCPTGNPSSSSKSGCKRGEWGNTGMYERCRVFSLALRGWAARGEADRLGHLDAVPAALGGPSSCVSPLGVCTEVPTGMELNSDFTLVEVWPRAGSGFCFHDFSGTWVKSSGEVLASVTQPPQSLSQRQPSVCDDQMLVRTAAGVGHPAGWGTGLWDQQHL